ncbi:hypothetical protein [Neisseria sp. Ec49-e6-T10]|uniref:hypothetical protein n=1 Tax=Neisseria sp. Ec49-e6-T10 TaxID=3140744 RepID=UPI003EB98CA2
MSGRSLTILLSFMFILTSNSYAQEHYPKDVSQFIDKRDTCDHLRGEVAGEAEIDGQRNIYQVIELACTGTDKQLIKLKKKYQRNAVVMSALNQYEVCIELSSQCGELDVFE